VKRIPSLLYATAYSDETLVQSIFYNASIPSVYSFPFIEICLLRAKEGPHIKKSPNIL